jgi:hypothetical protein
MKNFNQFILTLLAAGLFASCSLTEEPTSFVNRKSFYKNESQCIAALNSCYMPANAIYTANFMLVTEACTDIWYSSSTTVDACLDVTPAKPQYGKNVWTQGYKGVMYCNECVECISSADLADGVKMPLAAEARVMRAFYYYVLTCMFGDVPFTTETSPFGGGVNPKQASRKDVFDYCISELTDLASDESAMPAARSNYPRADKGAVNGLLARMYLNAEVYAGTPMWTEAKSACEAIFGMGYSLCPEYSDLFRGDNGENADALKEIIFGVAYDAEQTQSYGGTSYLTLAAIAATDVTAEQKINGVNNGWAGIRVPYEYVQKYFNARNADYTTGEYTVSDKRGGMFYIKGRQESMNDALYVFLNGWTCLKFNNIPHNMTNDEFLATAASKAYSDIDFPMIRLGEIYLIYAEACMNLGQANTALPKLQELSNRAGVSAPSSVTADYLLEERARELMWEGHRRTDLIRYGKFTTPSFLWTYKGGTFTGQGFDDYMKIFAIPSSELASNPELHQNPGYGNATDK